MNDVVIAGAGPNGLMLACELALGGIRPIVLDPLPGPNPEPRANGVTGQGVRILDHRGFYSVLTGTDDPPQPSPTYRCGRYRPTPRWICAASTASTRGSHHGTNRAG